MSGCTEAVIYTSMSSGAGTGASAVFSTLATTGGVVIAGAAVYLAARQMRADYGRALAEYQTRSCREAALHATQNAAFEAAQHRAREMALSLSPNALADPNTAWLLGGVGRLKTRLQGLGDPDDPAPSEGAALLLRECDELLARVAEGDASTRFDSYEKLSRAVSRLAAQRKERASSPESDTQRARLKELVREEVAVIWEDVDASTLSGKRHNAWRIALEERLGEISQLATTQPRVALQSLVLLRDRVRGELREAARRAARDTQNAIRMRELVGEISACAQAVMHQTVLEPPRREGELLLKRLSSLVAATPVELGGLETLAIEAQDLLSRVEKTLEEQAMAQYLEDQVAQVLGTLGYRVTAATSGVESKNSKMVAVLDSDIGVELRVDEGGHLSGEMVAFSGQGMVVDERAQERVCHLMDAVFDGLRRKNMTVREKKRKHFKPGVDEIKRVQTIPSATQTPSASPAQAQQMSVGE